jgi:rSAM/selenodomain-associated transferase 1
VAGVAIGASGEDAPAAAHAGIDHGQMDGAHREAGYGGREHEGGCLDVARRHLVGDVHELASRSQPEDGALDRGDVVVLQAKVGEQREERQVESPLVPEPSDRLLLVFTKPAREGRVKTRLIGDLTPAQAAELHAAFLGDLLDRLQAGSFTTVLAWALDAEDAVPDGPVRGIRQCGESLGERLLTALSAAAQEAAVVAAVGSDHPTLPVEMVHRAFERVEEGADVALGPAEDGGYYLIALRAGALTAGRCERLFEGIAWSTDQVFPATVERCRELGLRLALLPAAADVDTADDLRRLAAAMQENDLGCPRTRALLAAWRRL